MLLYKKGIPTNVEQDLGSHLATMVTNESSKDAKTIEFKGQGKKIVSCFQSIITQI